MKTQKIQISKIIDGGICVAADDGKKVYDRIYDALSTGHRVTLSFYGVTRMTTAFLNAAIGQMYGDFDEDFIKAHLDAPTDFEPWHLTRLKLVTDRAKTYFRNPELVENALKITRGE
ncbi:STAS-like domain-containing protein [Brucella sp. TWI432]